MMYPAQVAAWTLFDGGLAAIAAMAVLTSLASCLMIPSNASGHCHLPHRANALAGWRYDRYLFEPLVDRCTGWRQVAFGVSNAEIKSVVFDPGFDAFVFGHAD